jgi:hypothetical protein
MKILDTPRSGSVAGVTASRNRFGQYYRTRAIPVQPRTPKQTANRGRLTAGSSAWRTLSDAQRTGWNDYADQVTRSGSLGSSYSPTGAQLYSGSSIMNYGALTDPPDALPTYVLGITTMLYVDPTPGPEAFTVAIDATDAQNQFIIETSGPVSPGVTSAAGVRRWRSLPTNARNNDSHQFTMASASVPFLTNWKYLFPSPATGQSIWFRFREIAWPGSGLVPVTNRQFITFRYIVP